jgi:hypothetical protein
VSELPDAGHLDAVETAAFVNGSLDAPARAGVVEHLNSCEECRDEVMDASRIASTLPARHRWWAPVTGVAIAASLLVFLFLPRVGTRATSPEVHVLRGDNAAADSARVPTLVTPRDAVDRADRMVWSRVAGALSYRVRLFDDNSRVLWSDLTKDTVAVLPDSVRLRPRLTYFWTVDANTGFQHRASSDLVAFTITGPQP